MKNRSGSGKNADELLEEVLMRKRYVTVDDQSVTINVKYEYAIPRKQLRSNEDILAWMIHLCEKTWMTPEVLREFAYVAADAAHIKLPTL